MPDFPRVELGPGYSVARVINGCWQLTPDHGGGPTDPRQALWRFAELVDAGFTTFDCADIYAGTEELLGSFLASLPDPDSVQVHTKFVPDRDALESLDPVTIDAVIDRSLARLGVERLDLVQFHWWDYAVDGLEVMYRRLLELRDRGKIRLIGATNFNTHALQQLLAVDSSLASMQVQYSLLDRRPERTMIGCARDNRVGLLAYGALAGGFLGDAYLGAAPPAAMNRSLQKYRLIIDEAGGWPALQSLLQVLEEIANRHDVGIAQVAARWVLDRPGVAAIILGMGRRGRVGERRALCDLALDDEDGDRIGAALEALPVPPGEPYDIEREPGSTHAKILRTNLQAAGSGR